MWRPVISMKNHVRVCVCVFFGGGGRGVWMTEVLGSSHGVSYGRASDEGGIFSRFLKFLIGVRIKVKFGTIHGAVILIATVPLFVYIGCG